MFWSERDVYMWSALSAVYYVSIHTLAPLSPCENLQSGAEYKSLSGIHTYRRRGIVVMASRVSPFTKKEANRGAWTAEEDHKLAQVIAVHGAKRWKFAAMKAGLNRCGKSCRLRWMNYLRPNIKRGNISDQEEDLILRLHKLLGNRWSLIAGRLPGRTDNEIKNYWNSHLSKKMKQKENQSRSSGTVECKSQKIKVMEMEIVDEGSERVASKEDQESKTSFAGDELFDYSSGGPLNLEWMSQFLELDEAWFDFA